MSKVTKEELVAKCERLELLNEKMAATDSVRRKEFGKAFHFRDALVPSWEEIFVEVGKLLATRDFRDFEGNISGIECHLEDLERRIKSEVHPNI